MYSYGSYNKLRKPVILDSFIITVVGYLFSIFAGFIAWGAIGYLHSKGSATYFLTKSTGLAFIAFPTMAEIESTGVVSAPSGAPLPPSGPSPVNGTNAIQWYSFFMFTLYIAGLDTAFSYVEGLVTNFVDDFKFNRTITAACVCIFGFSLSAIFTTNWGWVLVDMMQHYIQNYIILAVGFLQCVAVGWFLEYDTTKIMSADHERSLRWLSYLYWFPMVTIAWYANFGYDSIRFLGIILIVASTLISLIVSFAVSKMPF
jgi:NSS family neurotransmitter:Na+ symporter